MDGWQGQRRGGAHRQSENPMAQMSDGVAKDFLAGQQNEAKLHQLELNSNGCYVDCTMGLLNHGEAPWFKVRLLDVISVEIIILIIFFPLKIRQTY